MPQTDTSYEQPVTYTLVHFGVTVAGNVLPLIVALLYYAAVGVGSPGLNKIVYGDGQFYIYAASFLTTAGFILFAYSAQINDRYFLGGLFAGAILLLISSLYAWKISITTFDDTVLWWTSMIPMVISIPIYFWATRLSHRYSDPSAFKYRRLLKARKEQREKLKKIKEALSPVNKQKEIDEVADDMPDA